MGPYRSTIMQQSVTKRILERVCQKTEFFCMLVLNLQNPNLLEKERRRVVTSGEDSWGCVIIGERLAPGR